MSALAAAKRRLLEEECIITKKKHKDELVEKKHKHKKDKKHKKKKSKKKRQKSSSESSSDSDDSNDEWVEKKASPTQIIESDKKEIVRDEWLNLSDFKTFSRNDLKADKPEKTKKQLDSYVPAQSSRELNPYWKENGTGLPSADKKISFKKPSYDGNRDDRYGSSSNKSWNKHTDSRDVRKNREDDRYGSHSSSSKSWRKPTESRDERRYIEDGYRSHSSSKSWKKPTESRDEKRYEDEDCVSNSSKRETIIDSKDKIQSQNEVADDRNDFLTDEEMNKLGAKIVKAEIMGNKALVIELTSKIEKAREYRKKHPEVKASQDNNVLLTMTNSQGNTKPLMKSKHGDVRSKGGKKNMETHSMSGERVRFFADDDKYSLKQMFEQEKFGNTDESTEDFAKAISKHKNPNDDLEEIFSENIRKNKSDAQTELQEMNKAISQHQTIQKSLETCEYCVESERMNKKMIISLGSKCYLALPERMSLVENHCIISTVSHVSCSTTIDEDVWSEILNYRKALTKMFNEHDEDVVFFETAIYLNKYPHLLIHCVPLPRDVGDMASIYFKKALLECEMEWSNNKKVVDLRGKDIRRGVPKGLPYFWVDFGMDPGFAHVIEDQQLFPRNFAQEIVGGMLDLDHKLWRKPRRESFELQMKKVSEFTKIWKSFDPNTK